MKIKRDHEKPDIYVWRNLSLHLIFDLKEGLIKRLVINNQVQVTVAVEMQVVLEIQSFWMINHSFHIEYSCSQSSEFSSVSFSGASQPSLQNWINFPICTNNRKIPNFKQSSSSSCKRSINRYWTNY